MERVQFQQEQMLAELKDLVQKGLFTQKETREILKRRTVFETALVRRVSKKADFLRYAAYEMGLEQLRRKRVDRLKLGPSPASVSDYALVRRQFHIFERGLKKFKGDVGLWMQYIEVARREGARGLQGRITARALQLHPNQPGLYILAASQEVEQFSPSAARTHLQRGIRLNSESVELWREYVKMELGYIERLRRRWEVLGIEGKGEESGEESEEGRREIMGGGIVKTVISSAAQAIRTVGLFVSLRGVLTEYPSPPSVQAELLGHLREVLRRTLPDEPEAVRLVGSRGWTGELKGEGLIDAIQEANEGLARLGDVKIYAEFVEEWYGGDLDADLRLYLTESLRWRVG